MYIKSYEDTWGRIDWDDGKPEDIKKQIKDLIEQGADVNMVDNLRKSPLTKALRYRYFDIADLLVLNGARPTMSDLRFFMEERQKVLHEVKIAKLASERQVEMIIEDIKAHTKQ